jgi:hypothetical protein
MINEKRIKQAVTASGHVDHIMSDPRLDDAQRATMLACELQRVNSILTGGAYYDYETQDWVED